MLSAPTGAGPVCASAAAIWPTILAVARLPAESPLVEDPALRQRYRFRRSTDPDGGQVLNIEVWVDPGGGVPPHVHPAMEERFEVLEGRAGFLAGRRWRTAGAGETVVVGPGVRHAYRNRGDEVAHLMCEARPPSSLQAFLEGAAEL